MILSKKVCATLIGATTIGGGVGAYIYLSGNNETVKVQNEQRAKDVNKANKEWLKQKLESKSKKWKPEYDNLDFSLQL